MNLRRDLRWKKIFKQCSYDPKEIARLDLTMQPLIQDIFSQILSDQMLHQDLPKKKIIRFPLLVLRFQVPTKPFEIHTYTLRLSWQEKCFIMYSIASSFLCSTYFCAYNQILWKPTKKGKNLPRLKRNPPSKDVAGFFGISIVLKGPLAAFDSFLFLSIPNKRKGMMLE